MSKMTESQDAPCVTSLLSISPPLDLSRDRSFPSMLPQHIRKVWAHWRLCSRAGRTPTTLAMEIRHLDHLQCLPRHVAIVAPRGPCGFYVLEAHNFRVADPSPPVDQEAGNLADAPPGQGAMRLLRAADTVALWEDWTAVTGGAAVFRLIAPVSAPKPRAAFRQNQMARLCLPLRTGEDLDVNAMMIAMEPVPPAQAGCLLYLAGQTGGEARHSSVARSGLASGLHSGPASEWTAGVAGDAGVGGDAGVAKDCAEFSHDQDAAPLPDETRLLFKQRIDETVQELRRHAAQRPDTERRGMLLEAARLTRLADEL